ncbi:MAG: glycosyltransferase family 2 protein, partial [Patescibacteria group bacterium]
MNLSVVIPNYNGEKIIGKNLPKVLASVKDYSSGSVEIIISDDCSSDNSLDIIQEFIKSNKNSSVKIKLLVSLKNKNEGFSSNVNRGVR